MKYLFIIFIILNGCQSKPQVNMQDQETNFPIERSEEEWKKELTAEEYRVLREKGTERAFSGEFYKHDEGGMYVCGACHQPLFSSETKYESGSGWPSFYAPMKEGNVKAILDTSLGMKRIEIICSNCGSHLGHVFEDGPQPTGKRYCINSVSLDFVKEKGSKSGDKP